MIILGNSRSAPVVACNAVTNILAPGAKPQALY
jgi:hypothetical protein